MTNPHEQRQSSTESIPSSDKSKDEKGMAQSSSYPDRSRKKDCQFYLQTGRCDYRRTCRHNHPPHLGHEFPEKTDEPVCKFFQRGRCKKGSSCSFRHIRDGSGPMRQMPEDHNVYARNQLNPEEHRHRELERQRMETRLRVHQELPEKTDAPVCQYFLRGRCAKGSGYKFRHIKNRDGSEPMRQSTSQRATESRREFEARIPMNRSIHAQENLQEQIQRDNIERQRREGQENLQERRQRDNIERQRREGQEYLQEQRHRDNIKRQRREAQENQQQQRMVMEIPENQNVEAHNQQNQEEQRKLEIERQRTEDRLRLDQMRPTALFDERSVPKEGIEELGLKDFEGI